MQLLLGKRDVLRERGREALRLTLPARERGKEGDGWHHLGGKGGVGLLSYGRREGRKAVGLTSYWKEGGCEADIIWEGGRLWS